MATESRLWEALQGALSAAGTPFRGPRACPEEAAQGRAHRLRNAHCTFDRRVQSCGRDKGIQAQKYVRGSSTCTYLPEDLGHVQYRLLDGQLIDGARAPARPGCAPPRRTCTRHRSWQAPTAGTSGTACARDLSHPAAAPALYTTCASPGRVFFMFWLKNHTLGTLVKPHSYRQQRQLLELLVLSDREIIAA